MRLLTTTALALALLLPCAAQAEECTCRPACKCGAAPKFHFGVDVDKLGKSPVKIDWHPHAITFFERWAELPERLENAVWYGSLAGSCGGVCIVGMLIVLTMNARAKP